MNSTENGTYDSVLLCEETMMNGDLKKVHPDLLQTQPELPKGFCSSKISWPRILCVTVFLMIVWDAQVRLGLQTFGVILCFVPLFLGLAKALTFNPNKVPPTMDGERIFGEIIHSFWVTSGGLIEVEKCYFIIQYTFEGITYQQKYLDLTWGMLATET